MLVTIVDAEPGRRISWRTSSLGVPSAEWIYEFEPTDDGCLVTETWIDRRYPWSLPISAFLSGDTAAGDILIAHDPSSVDDDGHPTTAGSRVGQEAAG